MQTVKAIDVTWSGGYPNLCSGTWYIKINGLQVTIPEEKRHSHFDTWGSYSQWFFDEDSSEYEEGYEDGLGEAEWIADNIQWLGPELERLGIQFTPDDWETLFEKVHEKDFRQGSCGGCI